MRVALSAAFVLVAFTVSAQPYRNPDLPVDERIADLLPRMTQEEKFWQLFMLAGSLDQGPERYEHGAFGFQLGNASDGIDDAAFVDEIQRHFVESTRLGIPVIFFSEALHGLVRPGATVYPQAIAIAATFDTELMGEIAQTIARECRRRGIRQVLSPVVNIADDVRWGRVEETYGEDPYLTTEMGVAFVTEFERRGVVATPKHLVANVGRGGRDSYPIHLGERLLREVHLPSFVACFERGGARSVMTSYNSVDGSPCSASYWLNSTWLKEEQRFPGFIISDAGAVGGANVLHGTAHGYADAGAKAVASGLDVIFQTSYDHADLFLPGFRSGDIPTEVVDAAVIRVLRAKFELGLFDQPFVGDDSGFPAPDPAHDRALARRAAQKSSVLLENGQGTLPLDRDIGSIAVIGPDAAEVRLGGYSGPGNDPVDILAGIRRAVDPSVMVEYALGCTRLEPGFETVPSEFLSCNHDGAEHRGLKGTYYHGVDLDGAPVLSRIDPQIAFRWTISSPAPDLLRHDFYSASWTGKLLAPDDAVVLGIEGDDGYRLYLDEEPVIDAWRRVSSGTRFTNMHLEPGRQYDVRFEFRSPTGQAQVRLIWDRGRRDNTDAEADLAKAESLAARCEVAVVVVGIEEGEFRDRAHLGLPGRQEELIHRVTATGTPTVVVLTGGSAITVEGWREEVAALLHVWYSGEAGGDGVADILFGDANPAGRLPISVPMAEGQLPLTYNHKPTGRGDDYHDLTGQPRYPFGYGLSYTNFAYSDLHIEEPKIADSETTTVSCSVTNKGQLPGDEVVQLYVRDELASVARPISELKGFQRIHLEPGEERIVRFSVGPEQLAMLDRNLRRIVEPGDFRLMIGASCRDIRLRGILTVGD